jgi:hypothetical protein
MAPRPSGAGPLVAVGDQALPLKGGEQLTNGTDRDNKGRGDRFGIVLADVL